MDGDSAHFLIECHKIGAIASLKYFLEGKLCLSVVPLSASDTSQPERKTQESEEKNRTIDLMDKNNRRYLKKK
jgi:hypothetical protein